MPLARVTEIKSSSKERFDDAIKSGLARAGKTLKKVRSAWIENQEILLDDKGQVSNCRVQMKGTLTLEE